MNLAAIFSKVLNMSVTASVVIVLVIAARFLLRRSPKVYSYALWAVVLFRLLCPVSIPSPVSLLGLLDAPVAASEGLTTAMEYIPYRAAENSPDYPSVPTPVHNAAAPAPSQDSQPAASSQKQPLSAARIAAYIWIGGAAIMVLTGIGSWLRFRKRLVGAVRVRDNIYLVDHMDSAFVTGLLRPKIYLPSGISPQQAQYILAHEQYHIRRLDPLVKHLAYAALCLHWFNPLVWLAFLLSGRDMEMRCDEAVIRQLGEGIRADYAASLLSLASDRGIIPGTPLAFGEGNTKGRIRNMARWKRPRKWVSLVSFLLCLAILTACAANPAQEVVTLEEDGSLALQVAPPETKPGETPAQTVPSNEKTRTVQYTDAFSSEDGTVDFTLSIDNGVSDAPMPVVEVAPHFLTEEDAKRVAHVLFGDADFYEAEPRFAPVYGKADIQEKLARWEPYSGDSEVDSFLAEYTAMLESAPEGNPHTPCMWTFRESTYYYDSPESAAAADTSDDNDVICASVKANGIPYMYEAITRNRADFKLNMIFVSPYDGLCPYSLDFSIFRQKLCQTDAPDASTVAAVKAKAETMLAQMELGDWVVDECYVETGGDPGLPEYIIHVNAVPAFHGTAVLRRPQLSTLRGTSEYDANDYLTDASLSFSANGDLYSFQLYSPMDVEEITTEGAEVLPMEEVIQLAKAQLARTDYHQYDRLKLVEASQEELLCQVEIGHIDYGLTRVNAEDTDERYVYVPTVVFYGNIRFRRQETGTIYDLPAPNEWGFPLLTLNAMDGTVVHCAGT